MVCRKRTIEPHRRSDSETEPEINFCFPWPLRHMDSAAGERDVNTILSDQIPPSEHTAAAADTA